MKFFNRPLSANATFKLCHRKVKRKVFEEKLDLADPNDYLKYISKRRFEDDPEFALDDQQRYMVFKSKQIEKKRQREKINELAAKKNLRAN
jgi:hypothetical protein